jgi:hypothetical protein
MTHEEAAAALERHARDAAAAFNRAGELLAECERQGVRPPDRVDGIDCDAEVELRWLAGAVQLSVLVGPGRTLVWEALKVPKLSPNAGAAARWLREKLEEGKADG